MLSQIIAHIMMAASQSQAAPPPAGEPRYYVVCGFQKKCPPARPPKNHEPAPALERGVRK